MGMFDYVKVQFPLPNPAHQDLEFQTKSLDCMLHRYVINVCGRLIYSEMEYIDDDEAEERVVRIVDADFHGKIRFYHYGNRYPSPHIEYEAIFRHGNCISIEDLTEYPPKIE